MGRINPSTRGTIPTDQDIDQFFDEVENALRAHGVRAVSPLVRTYALDLVKRFNSVEGPQLYPRVMDTEHRLQTERQNYLMYGVVDVLASTLGATSPTDREIWDYKASKRPDPRAPAGAARLADYEFQLRVYAELYKERNGQYPRRALIYFVGELAGTPPPTTTPPNAVMVANLQQTQVQVALTAFDSTVQQIQISEAQNQWNPPANGMQTAGKETCDLCDVRWSCPIEGPRYRRNPRFP